MKLVKLIDLYKINITIVQTIFDIVTCVDLEQLLCENNKPGKPYSILSARIQSSTKEQ